MVYLHTRGCIRVVYQIMKTDRQPGKPITTVPLLVFVNYQGTEFCVCSVNWLQLFAHNYIYEGPFLKDILTGKEIQRWKTQRQSGNEKE